MHRPSSRSRTEINVRPATVSDIDRCERMDSSFLTNHVWHMDEVVRPDQISISFQRVRLPRQMEIRDNSLQHDLFEVWQHSRCFLVADSMGVILGYLSLAVRDRTMRGWIERLIVHRPYRRRGAATMLLDGAVEWARTSGLRGLTIVVQSRNDPAISLLPKRGFAFRGYIDGYLSNNDLGLLYALDL